MSHFNRDGVAEARARIAGLKSRYGDVGSHPEDAYDQHMFGKSDQASGMHRAVQQFTDHLRGQYGHAERVLGEVERALDATEQDHMNTEQVNAAQFD